MEKYKKISLVLLLALVLLLCGYALATIVFQRTLTNTMKLNVTHDFALYQTGTNIPIESVDWDGFNESETKEFVFDLVYLGNNPDLGKVFWSGSIPTQWTLTIYEKNHDASGWNLWMSGEANALTGLEQGHRKNIKLSLTEVNAVPDTPYSFTLYFYSVDY
jgi:hypothetical protein